MSRVPLVIEKVLVHPVRIPYPRTIRWGAHSEDCADYLLIELVTRDGQSGIAEGTVKPNWMGATPRSLAVTIEEVFAPRLIGADIADEKTATKSIDRVPENRLAKAMIDVACWDLRAQAAGQPLWKLWGGERSVPVSWTVTRQEPAAMARDAADKIEVHGFRTLKIKTGQGRERDLAALNAIRRAVGESIRLYADSNGAYETAAVPDFTAGLKDRGVFLAEDPCHYLPDASFERLRQACAIPLLVDHDCRSLPEALLFAERGAEAVSIKIGKSGFSESWDIVRLAERRNVKSHVGMLGESSLGALAALQLAASLPGRARWLPAESSFFLTLPQEFVHAPLAIRDGAIVLPEEPSFTSFIDRDRLRALRP
ncbi:MAG: mandelate racemase/muconate lactonizing enzyme family protein [Xanthobacteraceae bacterium]